MPKQPESLTQFAARVQKPRCYLCAIPERQKVEESRKADRSLTYATIIKWLVEVCGHPADKLTYDLLANHFKRHAV